MQLRISGDLSLIKSAHNDSADRDKGKRRKNRGTEMNELIKIDQFVAERRSIM